MTPQLKERLLRYLLVFAAAFATTELANADNILNAHGLDAVKSAAIAAIIAGLIAGVDAVKAKLVPAAKKLLEK